MKIRLFPARWMAVGAVALLPAGALAQMPFSSTQSPGLSPFRGNNNLPPPTSSAPARSGNQQLQGYPNGGNTLMPGTYPQATAITTMDTDHKLGPRDVLSYSVREDRDDKTYQLAVTDSGEVELPLGSLRVKASGKTTAQLTSDIKRALESEYYKPGHATVFVGLVSYERMASKGKVYFTGEIATNGAIDLPSDGQLTVYQAILQLGGFTKEANLKKVFLYRKGGPKDGTRLDCKAVSNGDTSKDMVLQPGDTIKVLRKMFDFQY